MRLLVLLISASAVAVAPAAAQVSGNTTSTATSPAPITTSAVQAAQTAVEAPYWVLLGGYEGDTHGTGYGYFGPQWVRPVRDDLDVQFSLRGNYLMYEFEENGGLTKVRSPGLAAKVGVKFGDENWFKVAAGPSVKWRSETFEGPDGREIDILDDTEFGFSVGADAWLNPSDRDNIHLLMNYGTEDGYIWSRGGYRRQVSNYDWRGTWTHYLGGEVIAQGNDDIRSLQVGALWEILHAPNSASVMLRGGWKRSTFEQADEKTGPYFGIGYYHRLK